MAYLPYGLMFEVVQQFFLIQMKEAYGRHWKNIVEDVVRCKFESDYPYKGVYLSAFKALKDKGLAGFSEKSCDLPCIISLMHYDFLDDCSVGDDFIRRIEILRKLRNENNHNPSPNDAIINLEINDRILKALRAFLLYLSDSDWDYDDKDSFISFYTNEIEKSEMEMKEDFKTGRANAMPRELTNSVPEEEILFREDIIGQVLDLLEADHRKLMISGFGGIGKTSIARCLYHVLKDRYGHIAWIPYQLSLENSILQSFHCYEKEDASSRLASIKKFIQNCKETILLMIDNVDYIDGHDLYLEELTGTNVTMILTSRQESIAYFKKISVEELSEEECIDLFYYYYGMDHERKYSSLVRNLVRRFQYHTMTIELLAKSSQMKRFPSFYERLIEEGVAYPELKVRTNYTKNNETIASQLKRVFNIVDLNDSLKYILKNFAMMPSIVIPVDVEEWIGCDVNDLKELTDRGFLKFNKANDSLGYYMHPIVKETILLEDIPPEVGRKFIETLSSGSYSYCQYYYQYGGYFNINRESATITYDLPSAISQKINIAKTVLDFMKDDLSINYAKACANLGLLCQDQSMYADTEIYYKKAMNILIANRASDYDFAVIHTMRAIMEKYLSHFDKAEADFLKALDYFDHCDEIYPISAVTHNLLGDLYRIQMRNEEARKHLYKARDIRRLLFGDNSREIALSYNDCAIVDEFTGHYEEAEQGYKKAESIACSFNRTETPSMSAVYHNLGRLYFRWKKYELSLEYLKKALSLRLILRGKKHADTASTLRMLGEVYLELKDYEKSESFLTKAYDISKKVWVPEHTATARNEYLLAKLYFEMGYIREAGNMVQRVYDIYIESFGNEHMYTLSAKQLLSDCKKALEEV